jgi:hypothetical protein
VLEFTEHDPLTPLPDMAEDISWWSWVNSGLDRIAFPAVTLLWVDRPAWLDCVKMEKPAK